MKRYRDAITWLVISVVLLLSGCAQLPEYARPRFQLEMLDGASLAGGISYRLLNVEDFQAAALEDDLQQYHDLINARSCISIRPAESAEVSIFRTAYSNHTFYAGSISGVSFEALFIPACSWFNPHVPQRLIPYVLQHEQIHFAISELTARDLTRQAREEENRFIAFAESYQEVQHMLAESLRSFADRILEQGLAEHTEFDEDASMIYDHEKQNRWYERVMELLSKQQ